MKSFLQRNWNGLLIFAILAGWYVYIRHFASPAMIRYIRALLD